MTIYRNTESTRINPPGQDLTRKLYVVERCLRGHCGHPRQPRGLVGFLSGVYAVVAGHPRQPRGLVRM